MSNKLPKNPTPSDLELQILAVLWDQGPATARQVLDALPDGKQRAYTSVLSTMQVMQKKGLIKVNDRRKLAHVYAPRLSRDQILGPFLRSLVHKVFQGSPSAAVESLLDATALSDDELSQIQQLVRHAAKHHQKPGDKP